MVIHVSYNGKDFVLGKGESVLDCLLRSGQMVAYSCRAGMCHSCIMKTNAGQPPPAAQEGLHPSVKQQGFFLSCQYYPERDIEIVSGVPDNGFRYVDCDKNCQLVLVGVGAGLAPLYEIAKTATTQKHKGKISFYHGVNSNMDLYMIEELEALANEHCNFSYIPYLLSENLPKKIIAGLDENKNSIIVYLCGMPEMVDPIREQIFMAGVSPINIYVDY